MRLKFTFFIIVSILSFKHIVGRGNITVFYSKSGYSIVGISSLKVYVSGSKIECACQCAIEKRCWTASFDTSARKCYLQVTDVCLETEASQTSSVLYIGKTDGECIDPWKAFETHCYYFSVDVLSMIDAQNACKAMNGKMLKIDNSHENEWIKSVIRALGPPKSHLIGLQKVSGKWRWLFDNSKLDFTNWNPGEPSGDGNCVRLLNKDSRTWNDGGCRRKAPYICEKEKCSLKFDT